MAAKLTRLTYRMAIQLHLFAVLAPGGQSGNFWIHPLMINVYKSLVRNFEGRRPPERSRRRWVDSIEIYPKEIGCKGVDWIRMTQNRVQWRSLWTRQWTFGFCKRRGMFWLVEKLSGSEEGLFPMYLVVRALSSRITQFIRILYSFDSFNDDFSTS
jgi:hypothetical protein